MQLVLYGDERLNQKSEPVKEINAQLRRTLNSMLELMYTQNGVGISAPQVGILERFFIVDLRDGYKYIFINPEIIDKQELVECIEGCLSFPGIFAKVDRYKKIKVKALDMFGKEFTLEAEDLLAQVIQHEMSHLDGLLLIDEAKEIISTTPDYPKDTLE